MLSKFAIAAVVVLSLFGGPSTFAGDQKDKDAQAQLKIALDDLKAEVTILGRQIGSMKEAQDRNSGQVTALITQVIDNVAAIKQAQSRVSESAGSALTEVNGLGERLSATNQRIDRLSEQMAELKRLVENLPKLPTFTQITPGNPDQLFAAAYGDYSRGNYDLALSEFRMYVETFPTSEMADNAQYWVGECLSAQRKFSDAIAELDKVATLFPKGDKVPMARYKKALILKDTGQPDLAMLEFQAIVKLFPKSNEATLARQQLGEK